MAQFGPVDLQTLLAQILQQNQEQARAYIGQQQDGYSKAGAALGLGLNRLFGGSPEEQAMQNPEYLAAQETNAAFTGIDFLDPGQVNTRASEFEATGRPDLAWQIRGLAAQQQLADAKAREAQSKATTAEVSADVATRTREATIRERIATADIKDQELLLEESKANFAVAENRARELIGSLPDPSNPAAIRRVAASATAKGEAMTAFALTQIAETREEQLKADTEFERLISGLPKAEQERLKKERASTIASGRQNVTTRTLSPQAALELQNNLDELNRARNLVLDIKNTIASNPSAVGLAGSVRRGAQNITEAFESVMGLLGPEGESIASQAEETLNAAANDVFETEELRNSFAYDPQVSKIKNMENSLIYVIARSRQPTGKLLASTVALAKQDASLTGFTGASSVNDRMDQVLKALSLAAADLTSARDFYAPPEMIESLERNREKPVELGTSATPAAGPTIPGVDIEAIKAERARRAASGG